MDLLAWVEAPVGEGVDAVSEKVVAVVGVENHEMDAAEVAVKVAGKKAVKDPGVPTTRAKTLVLPGTVTMAESGATDRMVRFPGKCPYIVDC